MHKLENLFHRAFPFSHVFLLATLVTLRDLSPASISVSLGIKPHLIKFETEFPQSSFWSQMNLAVPRCLSQSQHLTFLRASLGGCSVLL